MSIPDAATRLCGVIGHPIAHSLSPTIHNAALRHDGRNAIYVAFDVTDVPVAVRGLAAVGAVGVNVTMPHKRTAWELATSRSVEAEATGVANTLVFEENGTIAAHNTDPHGILGALRELGVSPAGARCVVVGAGGAGRAAVWALSSAGASEVAVANRTGGRGDDLGVRIVNWGDLDDAVVGAEIVVHATAVGMRGEESLLAGEVLERAARAGCRAVLDLVYAGGGTDLVRKASSVGIAAADGLGVLVSQAAASYELFWGGPAPVAAMARAVGLPAT